LALYKRTVFAVLTALLSNVSLSASEESTFMKRTLLAVLFAITLSLTARADSFGIGLGSMTYPPYAPPPKVVQPSFSAALLGFGPGASMQGILPFWRGGVSTGGNSFSIIQNGQTLFQGAFLTDSVVRTEVNGFISFQIDAVVNGYFGKPSDHATIFLVFETLASTIGSPACGFAKGGAFCKTTIEGGFMEVTAIPEPSTLGLLGTGILGIFGVVRKKILAR
jgi:hypothetical protein